MQILINIDEGIYEIFQRIDDSTPIRNRPNTCWYAINLIRNGTVLPNNATNGDVIKAMFPNIKDWEVTEYKAVAGHYVNFGEGTIKIFTLDWWNAPYKADKDTPTAIEADQGEKI